MRKQVAVLKQVLEHHGEVGSTHIISAACSGSQADLEAFLKSNELWGGAGSIADQAGVSLPRPARRAIEAALIKLGEAQIAANVVNSRTAMWVEAFREFERRAI
jgi:hypothetical protein